jgi:hypothetical protein
LNPGIESIEQPWPAVTIGRVSSPEDAVFVDLDSDGTLDVVSSCEGKTRSVFVHWAPKERSRLLDESAWETAAIPCVQGRQSWMYALPLEIDGENGIDLVLGSKGGGASISWLQAPRDARDLAGWKLHHLRDAAWIMSIEAEDIDADGRQDIVFTDRKGDHSGAFWLRSPTDPFAAWGELAIGSLRTEAMFMKVADVDGDARRDVVVSTRNGYLQLHLRGAGDGIAWTTEEVPLPFGLPFGKSVAIADIDLDGSLDIVSTNRGGGSVPCVAWQRRSEALGSWEAVDIGGPGGSKFDLVELLDLDGDGDLDLITCEEQDNLGVVWYENPSRGSDGG